MDLKLLLLSVLVSFTLHAGIMVYSYSTTIDEYPAAYFKKGLIHNTLNLNIKNALYSEEMIETVIATGKRPEKLIKRKESQSTNKDSQGAITPAKISGEISPEYPQQSIDLGEEGDTTLIVDIDNAGNVNSVMIKKSSGIERLDTAARLALKKVRFIPAKKGNINMASTLALKIIFKLNN